MATSNTFSYTETAGQLIRDAFSYLDYIDLEAEDDLEPGELNYAMRELNRLFKSVQNKNAQQVGMKVWQRQVGFLFLNANSGQYVLAANTPQWANSFVSTTSAGNNAPGSNLIYLANVAGCNVNTNIGLILDNGTLQWTTVQSVNVAQTSVNVATALNYSMNSNTDIAYVITDDSAQPPQSIDHIVLRTSTGNDLDMDLLTLDQYASLPGKNQTGFRGDPQAVYYESHLVGNAGNGFGYLRTDVAGAADVTKYFVIYYVRELQDINNVNNELDCPKEYFSAMMYTLAKRLAPFCSKAWSQVMEDNMVAAQKLAGNSNPKRFAARFVRRGYGATWNSPPHR